MVNAKTLELGTGVVPSGATTVPEIEGIPRLSVKIFDAGMSSVIEPSRVKLVTVPDSTMTLYRDAVPIVASLLFGFSSRR